MKRDEDYEGWDEAYSHPLSELPWELGRPRPQLVEIIERRLITPGKALDICCGAGTNTVYLASKGFEVTGIDISPKAVEIAKEKARKANMKIRFEVGNVIHIPFEDREFDFVFDMGCFHHIMVEDREPYISGVYRVLKPGGVYQLTCFSYKNGPARNNFAKNDVLNLFSSLFRVEDVTHFGSVEGDGVVRYFYTFLMKK